MKKTIQLTILLAALMSMGSSKLYAYDIAVENEDGVTIYYNYINGGTELEVTSGYSYSGLNNLSYSGSVNIPEEVIYMSRARKVTNISKFAFSDCHNLTSVSIPNSVTSIGESAFQSCGRLTSITIPYSVTNIGASAFYQCSSLTSITIPYSVTSIGTGAFYGCSISSFKVSVTDNSAFCNNILMKLLRLSNNYYWITLIDKDGNEINDFIIPNDVTSIGDYTFWQCTGLTSITIPSSVTSIGAGAFYSCTGLTSITIPSSVTSIGESAFERCSGLTSITIPNSVTSISDYAFHGCSGLTSVTIPESVTSIGDDAFSYCTGLTSITIPNSVTSIENHAFLDCSSLASIIIPNSVTSIGNKAFANCDILEVISMIENPFNINTSTFSDNTYYNATLYVPTGTIDKYKATEGWKKFLFYEERNGGGSTPPVPEQCSKPTIYYTNGKLSYKSETEGVTFQSTITDTDMGAYSSDEVDLTVTYHISVYAMKEGYENSETAEATLCWIEVDPQKEGITEDTPTEAKQLQALPVLIQAEDGQFSVEGAPEGTKVAVYDAGGVELGAAVSRSGKTLVPARLPKGSIAIVKIGERRVKVVTK